MSIHIIIDGYNLIRQSSELSRLDQQDIQLGREALIDILAMYKKIKRHRITIVFDGAMAPRNSQQQDRQKGILIIFSKNNESADSVIKKIARSEREKVLIVSSDRAVIRSAASFGSATISADDFEKKLFMARHADDVEIGIDDSKGWKPTTKKKGPSRRPSRRQRRNRRKIRKL